LDRLNSQLAKVAARLDTVAGLIQANDQAGAAAAWLKDAMLDRMSPLIDPVPVEVEVKVAQAWGGD
jgi:hypothetical protein